MTKRLLNYLANKPSLLVETYLKRGRQLKDTSTEILKESWAIFFKKYILDSSDIKNKIMMDDCESELALRNEEPPYDQVKKEVDEFSKKANDVIENMSPQRKREIDLEILQDLNKFESEVKNSN